MTNRTQYDAIIVGGGHNGLTVACYLAKQKKKVLVVEKRNRLGGLGSSSEFHAGYFSPGILHDTNNVRTWVIDQLQLKKYGLKTSDQPESVFSPSHEGLGLLLHHDPKKAADEIAKLSAKDAEAYRQYRAFFKKIESFVKQVFDQTPPSVYALNFYGLWDVMKKAVSLRMLGQKDMMEILRIGPLCVADWLNEWFENDLLKATLAGPAVYGTWCGPWSPGTNANLIAYEALSQTSVLGGTQSLIDALTQAGEKLGVETICSTAVKSIQTTDDQVTGIELDGGKVISAKTVVATCDPKTTFEKLMDPSAVPFKLQTRIEQYRTRGTTAKMHLALSGPLEFNCRPGYHPSRIRIGENLDAIEKAFDAVKYRDFSVEPALDIQIPTLHNPDLAPSGHHVASIMVNFAAYDLKAGWNDEQKSQLAEAVIARLESYSPNIRQQIVASELLSPADLEREYGISGGHIHHGEHATDQMLMRPTPETANYETPITGLFLAGSGNHPGGGITCAPGAIAARHIH